MLGELPDLLDWHPEASLSPSNLLGALPSAHRDMPAQSRALPVESQTGERIAVTFHHGDSLNLLIWLLAVKI